MRVGATRKSDLQRLAHYRMSAVAAGEEAGLDGLLRPIGPPPPLDRPHAEPIVCRLPAGASRIRTISTAWHNQVYREGLMSALLASRRWKRRREREPTLPGCRASSAGLMVRIRLPPSGESVSRRI